MGGVINDSGVGLPSGPMEWAVPDMEWAVPDMEWAVPDMEWPVPDKEWAGPDMDCPWRRFLCVPTCSRTVRMTFFLSSSLRIPDLI